MGRSVSSSDSPIKVQKKKGKVAKKDNKKKKNSRTERRDKSFESIQNKNITRKITKKPAPKASKSSYTPSIRQTRQTRALPKRVRKVKNNFTPLKSFRNFSSSESSLVQQILNSLKNHLSSYVLMFPEQDMGYITQLLIPPFDQHITLNDITIKINEGQYQSAAAFYTDVTKMFKRNLRCLPKGQILSKVEKIQQIYIQFLQKHNLQDQINEYEPDQEVRSLSSIGDEQIKKRRGFRSQSQSYSQKQFSKRSQRQLQKQSCSKSKSFRRQVMQSQSEPSLDGKPFEQCSKLKYQNISFSQNQKVHHQCSINMKNPRFTICSQLINITIRGDPKQKYPTKNLQFIKTEHVQEEEIKSISRGPPRKSLMKQKKVRKYQYSSSSASPSPVKEKIVKRFKHITEILPMDSD